MLTSLLPPNVAGPDVAFATVYVGNVEPTTQATVMANQLCTEYNATKANNASTAPITLSCEIPLTGRYLAISAPTDAKIWLTLCEVEPSPTGEQPGSLREGTFMCSAPAQTSLTTILVVRMPGAQPAGHVP